MKIGILTAMDREYDMVSRVLGGGIDGKGVVVSKCGMGKVNSAVNAYRLIVEQKPDCIISSGCAGGLAWGVRLLDIVVGSEVVYHDVWYGEPNLYGQVQGFPARFGADPTLLACARSLSASNDAGEAGALRFGLIASGDRFCSGIADNNSILGHFPEALAVDMESGSISQVCYTHGVPFISFRVISDTSSEDNRLAQFTDFWDSVGTESFALLQRFVAAL